MDVLSPKSFARSVFGILALALAGTWFGWQLLWLPGLIMFIAAFVLFVVMYSLDYRHTEQEEQRRWKIAQDQGMLRYVIREFIGSLVISIPMIAFYSFVQYRGGDPWSWRYFLFIGLMVGGSAVIPLVLWYLRERRFRRQPEDSHRAA